MGITYFALGMLSMVALIFVGVIVWGLFRVSRIEKEVRIANELNRDKFDGVYKQFDNIQRQIDQIYRSIDNVGDNYRREFEHFHREFTDKCDKIEQFEIKRFDELLRIINARYDDSIRYTDKRIDKSLNQKEVI